MKTIKCAAMAAMLGLGLFAGAARAEVEPPARLPDFKIVNMSFENRNCQYTDVVITIENTGTRGNAGRLNLSIGNTIVRRTIGDMARNERRVVRFNRVPSGRYCTFEAIIDAYNVTRESVENNNDRTVIWCISCR